MREKLSITGASQRVNCTANDLWTACYICHQCGEEFACSSDHCRNEEAARGESRTAFNMQQRRYCYICGYKLSTREPIPENEYIAELNAEIDKLNNKLWGWRKLERNARQSVTDAAWRQFDEIVARHKAEGCKNQDIEGLLLMVIALADENSYLRNPEEDGDGNA